MKLGARSITASLLVSAGPCRTLLRCTDATASYLTWLTALRGDRFQIPCPFGPRSVRFCFLSDWQEEAVFFGTECLLLFQTSRLLPTVCCATAGCGRGLNGEYERTTWFDFSYFCSRLVFSALSNMKPDLPLPSVSPVKNSPHLASIYSPQMLHYKLREAVYLKEHDVLICADAALNRCDGKRATEVWELYWWLFFEIAFFPRPFFYLATFGSVSMHFM